MIDGIPVIDGIVHAYNLDEANFRNRWAAPLRDLVYTSVYAAALPGYRLPKAAWARDWSMEEVANLTFVESYADVAVHHVLPIGAFHDGLCSLEKTLEAKERWPGRFVCYCGVDPLAGEAAIEELDRQVEILDPVGVKLYPNSWTHGELSGWHMDDPEVAFPVFDRARQLGLKVVAVHKAVPLGPVPMEHYRVDDIDRAAIAFPDLNFEIVHGGVAFVEETAWQLKRFDNVYVNLEITCFPLLKAPGRFSEVLSTFLRVGGATALDRIVWGTGAMVMHPRPLLETLVRSFAFSDDEIERRGMLPFGETHLRKILSENYVRMTGVDLTERLAAVANDEFVSRRSEDEPSPPYSTTASAGRAE